MKGNQLKSQHLLWRAGFGPSAEQLEMVLQQPTKKILHSILESAQKEPEPFDVAAPSLKALITSAGDHPDLRRRNFSAEERKNFRKQSVEDIKTLNLRWLQEMTDGEFSLREKMSLFWHGHFATKTVNILYDQALLNIIRRHALGNFRDLLVQVSKSAAMIRFLNNNQNKKDHPNENFARELMELFTLGRGNYTEQDVKASARAFTGWGIGPQGSFEFHSAQHDDGEKAFLGKNGHLSGDDVLEILLEKRQTAVFITRKIYCFFVNDIPDEERVNTLAKEFYQNGYDIAKLMAAIFDSDWFYDKINIGTHIKSPVEWLVGIRRQLPQKMENPEVQILLQRLLGQVLFNPPNVAGWPGGKHWINSSSLMLRMRIPQMIYSSDAILAHPKADDDLMMGMKDGPAEPDQMTKRNTDRKRSGSPNGQIIRTRIYWEDLPGRFRNSGDGEWWSEIHRYLLQFPASLREEDMRKYLDSSDRESLMQSAFIRFMSTPEYQLC
jgi:uncharacterized protein (DUF1800 family)